MNLVIALPNDKELAESLGKKGSENGITFYNRKFGDKNVALLVPTNINEKYSSLPQMLLLADSVLLSTKNMDSLFAEVIACCELLHKKLVLTKDNSVENIIKGLEIDYDIVDKENIAEFLTNYTPNKKNEDKGVRIVLDRAFPVKGIGEVALGIIRNGQVHVHDTLFHSSGKGVTIKHIQVNDVDVEKAEDGTRVGLAIKGLDSKEVERGDLLSNRVIKACEYIEAEISLSRYAKGIDIESENVELAGDFTYSSVKLTRIDEKMYKLKLAKKLSFEIGDTFILVKQKSPRMFAVGKVIKTASDVQ